MYEFRTRDRTAQQGRKAKLLEQNILTQDQRINRRPHTRYNEQILLIWFAIRDSLKNSSQRIGQKERGDEFHLIKFRKDINNPQRFLLAFVDRRTCQRAEMLKC